MSMELYACVTLCVTAAAKAVEHMKMAAAQQLMWIPSLAPPDCTDSTVAPSALHSHRSLVLLSERSG